MMIYRSLLCVSAVAITFLTGCTKSSTLTSIQVTPSTVTIGTIGGTGQFTAIGTYSRGGNHPVTTQNITDEATWASSSTDVATIDSTGLATAVGAGTTTITATMNGSSGPVVGSAVLTVTTGVGGQRQLVSISAIPPSQTLNTIGETAQFIAIGTFSAPPTTENLAGNPFFQGWGSSDTDVATINSSGLATAVDCGVSSCVVTLTASYADPISGTIIGTASLTVSPGGPPPTRALSAITIFPGAGTQTLYTLGETAQFIATGTYTAAPTTVDITDLVTWAATDPAIATINSSGLTTAVSCGVQSCISNITASVTDPVSGFIVGTSNITVEPNGGGSTLPSLSVYLVGAGTGTVVSSPAGINCSGSGQGCTAYFPKGSTVTLTASPSTGGWSSNCNPDGPGTSCSVIMSTNQTVGAIFN